MKNARAVTGPGVDVAIGVALYPRFAGESRPASTVSKAWVEFPMFARVVVRLFVTLFRLRLLLGRKLITCFCDVNYFAELFSRRFSAARAARAERVADANATVRHASPRGRRKQRKTRHVRATARDATRATLLRASASSDLESPPRRRRAAAAAGRARRVDLAKVRGFFPDAASARHAVAAVAAKKTASSPARVGCRGGDARQAASADSSAT